MKNMTMVSTVPPQPGSPGDENPFPGPRPPSGS
jgi:hypothetical protein